MAPRTPEPVQTSSPPGSVGGVSTAATAGTSDFGTTVDELDASVADVLERISALAEDGRDDQGAEEKVAEEKGGEAAAARRVRLIYSDEFLKHRSPRGAHPECPERLEVIVEAINADERLADVVDWVEPTPVDAGSARRDLVLELVHEVHTSEDYLEGTT